ILFPSCATSTGVSRDLASPCARVRRNFTSWFTQVVGATRVELGASPTVRTPLFPLSFAHGVSMTRPTLLSLQHLLAALDLPLAAGVLEGDPLVAPDRPQRDGFQPHHPLRRVLLVDHRARPEGPAGRVLLQHQPALGRELLGSLPDAIAGPAGELV